MQTSIQMPCVVPFKVEPPKRLVLQVEDNEANASLVQQLIARRSDLSLLTVTTGSRGVEMAMTHRPDVILLDINLPDMDGYAALAALRVNALTCHIPVIALSCNAYPNQIQKGLEAGFFRYLTKPFKLDELMNIIDLALDSVPETDSACCALP